MNITELSIKRPALVSIFFIALAVMGFFGYTKLGVDLLPKMDFPFVSVLTYYPGAGPEEIEDRVSKPIEEAVAGTSQIDNVRSYSFEGYSLVLGQYLLTANGDQAAADVQRRVELVRGKLPKDALSPKILKNDIGAAPILRISMTSTKLTPTEAYTLVKDKLQARFESVEGLAQANITGGHEREIRVAVDNDKLRSYNLSINQVAAAMDHENLNFPTGTVNEPSKEFTVRVQGKFTSLDEMSRLPTATTPNGTTVYLADIATVVDTYKEHAKTTRLQSADAIGLQIIKQSDANATEVADRTYNLISKLQTEYASEGLKFTIAQDATDFTRSSLKWVFIDLALAIIFVASVLFLFLRSFKNAMIVLVSIPTSLITTFIFMWAFGFTLNMMSTMALSLVIGILVDDSIVVLENIHRKLDEGLAPFQAAIQGRMEIGFAAIAITLVDVVVFLPISLVQGLAGKIFREFGLTVVISTLISLLVSFTLTPLMASRFATAHETVKNRFFRAITDRFEAFQDWLERIYAGVLEWSLNHRWVIVTSCFLLFLGSCGLVVGGKIGGEFITPPDRGEFAVNFEVPSGTNIETTDSIAKLFEGMLAKQPDIVRYLTITGEQENPWGKVERGNVGQIQVKMVEPSKRSITMNDMMNKVQVMSKELPGLKVSTSPIGIFGTANQPPIQLELVGDNLTDLANFSDTVMAHIRNVPGVKDLKSSYEEGQPEVQVVFDRDRLSASGLSLGEAALSLRTALAGNTDAKFKDGETEYDINVILGNLDRSNSHDVANVTLQNHSGQQIKLSDVASIYFGKGPTQINRKNRQRQVVITGGLDNRPLGDVVNDVTKVVTALPRPASIGVPYFAGDAENQQKAMADLLVAIGLAILFVYMIMVALFESYVHPFTIMFALPVSLVGALGFLALFHLTLSLFTFVGLIMLMGLVTKNAILIVDRTNSRRALGHGIRESLLEAGPTRLRPIIMTTVTMILGMMPMALGIGDGAEMRQGMAVALVGGLLSSMILSLVLVPVMYTFMEGLRVKVSNGRKPRSRYGDGVDAALAGAGGGEMIITD